MDPSSERVRFGPFEIHVPTGELNKDGVLVRLAPQPARVLALLARRSGELVSREEIQAEVWRDGTTVEFDQGLNYCVRQIRLVLEDDAKEPRYVETVPKRGYRLRAPVAPAVPVHSPVPTSRWSRTGLVAGLIMLVGLVAWSFTALAQPRGLPRDAVLAKLYTEAERMANTWNPREVKKAVDDFREVIRRQEDFAPAYARLANALVLLPFMGVSAGDVLPEAELMASKAIELDPSLADAHAALAHCLWQRWMWTEAGAEFERAVGLDANSAMAHQQYGLYLAAAGHGDEAIQHARRAVQLAPNLGVVRYSLAQVYFQSGHFEEAIAASLETLAVDPKFVMALQTQFRATSMQGKLEEAGSLLGEPTASGNVPWGVYWLARSGKLRDAHTLWEAGMAPRGTGNSSSMAAAIALASMGEVDATFDSLKRSVDKHMGSMIWLNATPELQAYREDPRYAVLLMRIGLPQ